jgi:hypothetical protein
MNALHEYDNLGELAHYLRMSKDKVAIEITKLIESGRYGLIPRKTQRKLFFIGARLIRLAANISAVGRVGASLILSSDQLRRRGHEGF